MTADAAPSRLAIIQQLANSYDDARGRDELPDIAAASTWLSRRELLPEGVQLPSSEFALLRQLRATIRGLCLANSGCEGHPEDLAFLNDVVRQAGLHPSLQQDGQPTLAVDTQSGLASSGRLVGIVFEALWAGTWARLKACPGEACNYAFYDGTRNNSRTWCAMARCGSRAKMRAYRERQRSAKVGGDKIRTR
jgi:predicted RNA-binding Zn ribbon-like protein